MIKAESGEFKCDGYELVIHPDLTLSEFKDGDIPISKASTPKKMMRSAFWFAAEINGLKAEFGILFVGEHLHELRFEQEEQQSLWNRLHKETVLASKDGPEAEMTAARKWSKILSDSIRLQKEQNDVWLAKTIGRQPPYDYNWGRIVSFHDPRQDNDAVILAEFKYSFLDRGFPDLQSYLTSQRRSWNKMIEGIEREARRMQ
jgi:hypothetical protein